MFSNGKGVRIVRIFVVDPVSPGLINKNG